MKKTARRLTGILLSCLLLLNLLPAGALAAAPALTELTPTRQSDTAGQITFTSDVAGSYCYEVLEAGGTASGQWTGSGEVLQAGANTLALDGLTPGAKDILIRADLNGETADYTVTLPAYTPDTGTDGEGDQAKRVAVVPLKEALSALGTTTQLPYSGQYELGSEAVLYEAENGSQSYGTLFRVDAQAGTLFQLEFWSETYSVDTVIRVYKQAAEGGIEYVNSFNQDNQSGLGESAVFLADEAGTYYFGFLGYGTYDCGLCQVRMTATVADQVALEDALADLDTATQLPYSGQYELGSEAVLYKAEDGSQAYGTLFRAEAQAGTLFQLEFWSETSGVDAVIWIYKETTDGIEYVNSFNRNNQNGLGESAEFFADEAGTYYFGFLGHDTDDRGLCQVSITAAVPDRVALEDALAELDTTTQLPYSGQYELGSEAVLYTAEDGSQSYGTLFQVEAQTGTLFHLEFWGETYGLNTVIRVYRKTADGIESVTSFNRDNQNGAGESVDFTADEAGTYYFGFLGHDIGDRGLCQVSITAAVLERVALKDALAELDTATVLPYSGEYELGSEAVLYEDEDGDQAYGTLFRAEAQEAGTLFYLEFWGMTYGLDTVIRVYRETADGIESVYYYDYDNQNGAGESVDFFAGEAGTYYFAFLGNDTDERGLCQVSITAAVPERVALKDALAELDTATVLPYSGQYELGSEAILYEDEDGYLCYGTLFRVETQADTRFQLEFWGETYGLDTVIWVYKQAADGSLESVAYFDRDNQNGAGESVSFTANGDGTYYFAFLGYDEDERGLCQVSITAAVSERVALKEALAALDTTTQLPYSGQYELGSEAVLYEDEDGNQAYGTLFRVEAQANTLFQLDFWGSDDADIDAAGIDTQICVYRQQGDDVVLVGTFDRNGRGLGESIRYQAAEAGTYYFAFLGLSAQEYGWCHCGITAYEQSPDSKLQTLDFTVDPVPEPESGDLWHWNAATLTLTLMDGFSMHSGTVGTPTIKLPGGSTVVLEGEASLCTGSAQSIQCLGDLTIRGDSKDAARLTGVSSFQSQNSACQVIMVQGKLTVENCALILNSDDTTIEAETGLEIREALLQLETERNGLKSGGNVVIQGAEIDIVADTGIYAKDNDRLSVEISASQVNINADQYGIEADGLFISSSEIRIDAPDDECIYTETGVRITDQSIVRLISHDDEAIYTYGSVFVFDSTLYINVYEEGIQMEGYDTKVAIWNSDVSIYSEYREGIYGYEPVSLSVVGSTLDIKAEEEGIQLTQVNIQNSDVSIWSEDEEGIDVSNLLSIAGGRIKVVADENALEGNAVYLTNVLFDLTTIDNYLLIDTNTLAGFSLPGDFFLYDLQGTQIYEGSWNSGLFINGDLQSKGVSAKRALSTSFYHEHLWSDEWFSDDAYHWHQCEADYCLITNHSEMEGYGEHIYDQQLTTDHYLASEATCTAPAMYYYACVCGKAGTETYESGLALGHSWEAPQFNWSADGKTCTVSFTCDRCGEVETLEATVTAQETKAPTCTAMGETTYTATLDWEGEPYSESLARTDLPALGHDWEAPQFNWSAEEDPDYQPFVPVIIRGANGTWQKGTKTDLSFTSNAEFADFLKVQVDGKDLDADNYILREGSTVVDLKAAYLETLTVGQHTLSVVSRPGTATTTFTITAAPETAPKTGDSANVLLGTLALLAASGVLVGLMGYSRRKRGKHN